MYVPRGAAAACAIVAFLYILAVHGCPDHRIIRYYKELGCSPIPADSDCPTSFDCGERSKQDTEKCWLKGKQYFIGEDVGLLDDPCISECSCRVNGKRAGLSCITSECPEHMFDVELPKGCYLKHDLDTCCATGELCVNNDTDIIKCHYNGKDYYDGQLLYNSSDPCKICVCDSEFNSTGKPHCREASCGLELHWAVELQKGCAPIFYGNQTCCPIEWRCPRRGDRVIHRKTKKPLASTNPSGGSTHVALCAWLCRFWLTQEGVFWFVHKDFQNYLMGDDQKQPSLPQETVCHFGGLRLQVGEILMGRGEKRGSCQQCSCQLPPHVTCIQKNGCKSSPGYSLKALDA